MPYKKRKDNLWCVYKHTSPSGGEMVEDMIVVKL